MCFATCSHKGNPSIPFRTLQCPHARPHAASWLCHLSIVALDEGGTWLRPIKLVSHVGPGPTAVPWVAGVKPGSHRDPPATHGSQSQSPPGSPSGQRWVPALRGGTPSLSPSSTPVSGSRFSSSLSQQRKTSLDGNCRRVVTATLLQDFTRNPAFCLKKTLKSLLAPAVTGAKPNGARAELSGTEGPSHPNWCHPGGLACPCWGQGHGVHWGPGDGGCCSMGAAQDGAIGGFGAML